MKLEVAEVYAAQVCEAIKPYVCKVEVVGSIRRRHPEVNDVDLIAISLDDTAWRAIPGVLFKKLQASIILRGMELIGVTLPHQVGSPIAFGTRYANVQIDIYRARAHTWGVLELIRTGSKEHNTKLCAHALVNHMMLSAAKGVIKDGFVVASRTEEEIFAALGLAYVEPKNREVLKGGP